MIVSMKHGKGEKTNKRTMRVFSSTLTLLAILLFVTFASQDFSELYSTLSLETKGTDNDNVLEVQAAISHIKQEIEQNSVTSTRNARDAVATGPSRKLVSNMVVHGPNNYKHTGTAFDAQTNFQEILNTSPVVLFVADNADSQKMRSLLSKDFQISPPPAIVDLEKHSRGTQLKTYILENCLAFSKLPNPSPKHVATPPFLFINGKSVINSGLKSDILDLHAKGELLARFKSFGSEKVLFQRTNAPSNS
ncbi:LAMI_0F04280g1_1 [Lachancea mirantina]|uniref:LAMI_0F04280g1_1 n=1 Tax=Lachancea mirantina TaxID=1230905 RepID=A0A1G4JXS6_9SACH|nr:LAMI_0F04280g1_1 [Lachancea mirantina]